MSIAWWPYAAEPRSSIPKRLSGHRRDAFGSGPQGRPSAREVSSSGQATLLADQETRRRKREPKKVQVVGKPVFSLEVLEHGEKVDPFLRPHGKVVLGVGFEPLPHPSREAPTCLTAALEPIGQLEHLLGRDAPSDGVQAKSEEPAARSQPDRKWRLIARRGGSRVGLESATLHCSFQHRVRASILADLKQPAASLPCEFLGLRRMGATTWLNHMPIAW